MRSALLAGLALASCTASKPSPERASRPPDLGLPVARGPLEFPSGAKEVKLAWLVGELARLTGQELTMPPQVRQQLEQLAEPLEITAPVPADEVYTYVEAMLSVQGFLIAPVKSGERPVLGVYSSASRRPEQGEIRAVLIEPGQVESLADHPALYCQVMLVFENLDSRQLQTQLRQLLADSTGMKQCVPAGDRALLIQAPGAQLLGLARMLREVDLASAAPRPIEPQPASSMPYPTSPRTGG